MVQSANWLGAAAAAAVWLQDAATKSDFYLDLQKLKAV
jgi:hypothetical protein